MNSLKTKAVVTDKKIYQRKRFWAGLLLAQFILFFIFSKIEFFIKTAENFFELQKGIHQKIFSVVPFSIGDVFYILLGLVSVILIILIIRKKSRNNALLTFLILLNILYFTYQIFWGMLYFQKPLIEKLSSEEPTQQETKRLALKYLELCKQSRNQVKEDRNGVFKVYDLGEVKAAVLKKQTNLPLNLTDKQGNGISSFKPSLFKSVMSDTGILGYYNPFSAEAQYNPQLPSTFLPFTIAHESAHQLGFAREQEANFIGYLIGRNSPNTDLKYSTDYFVLKSLLNSLSEENPEFVKFVIRNYSAGMKRDRMYEKMFIKRHSGMLDAFFGFTNDLFLKSNQQEGRVTYSYFVDLLIRYERENQ